MIIAVIWVVLAVAGVGFFGGLLVNALIDLWIARKDPDGDTINLAVGDVRAYAALLAGQLVFLLAGGLTLGARFVPIPGTREAIICALLAGEAFTMLVGLILYRARRTAPKGK